MEDDDSGSEPRQVSESAQDMVSESSSTGAEYDGGEIDLTEDYAESEGSSESECEEESDGLEDD